MLDCSISYKAAHWWAVPSVGSAKICESSEIFVLCVLWQHQLREVRNCKSLTLKNKYRIVCFILVFHFLHSQTENLFLMECNILKLYIIGSIYLWTLLEIFIYEKENIKKIRPCRQSNCLFIRDREVFLVCCCCCCFVFCWVFFIAIMILNHDLFYLDSVTYKICQFLERNKEKTLLVLKTWWQKNL